MPDRQRSFWKAPDTIVMRIKNMKVNIYLSQNNKYMLTFSISGSILWINKENKGNKEAFYESEKFE